MSHFSVLVAAKDYEDLENKLAKYKQLGWGADDQPYIDAGTLEVEFEIEVPAEEVEQTAFDCVQELRDSMEKIREALLKDGEDEKQFPFEKTKAENIAQYKAWIATAESKLKDGDFSGVVIDYQGGGVDDEGNIGYYVNPNGDKWDWWEVGGRWTGTLKLKVNGNNHYPALPSGGYLGLSIGEWSALLRLFLKHTGKYASVLGAYDVETARKINKQVTSMANAVKRNGVSAPDDEIEQAKDKGLIGNGRPGVMTEANADPMRCDYAPAGLIDWEGMRAEKIEGKMEDYILFQSYKRKYPLSSIPFDKALTAFKRWEQAEVAQKYFPNPMDYVHASWVSDKLRQDRHIFLMMFEEIADLFFRQEDYEKKIQVAPLTWAMVDLEGNWIEQGKMGMWAMSIPAENPDEVNKTYWDVVESLPHDQLVFLVDCHI
jgi:hypothetical protein